MNVVDRFSKAGTRLRRLGRLDEAEVYLRAALRFASDHQKPRLALRFAYLLRDRGRVKEAAALGEAASLDFQMARKKTWYYRAQMNLGALRFALPDMVGSIRASREALRGLGSADPRRLLARLNLARGLAYVAEGDEHRELEDLLGALRAEGLPALHQATLDQYEAVQAWRVGLRRPAERALREVETKMRILGSEVDAAATVLDRLILMAIDGRFEHATARELSEVFNTFGYHGLKSHTAWISEEARRASIRHAVTQIVCRFARQIPVRGRRSPLPTP